MLLTGHHGLPVPTTGDRILAASLCPETVDAATVSTVSDQTSDAWVGTPPTCRTGLLGWFIVLLRGYRLDCSHLGVLCPRATPWQNWVDGRFSCVDSGSNRIGLPVCISSQLRTVQYTFFGRSSSKGEVGQSDTKEMGHFHVHVLMIDQSSLAHVIFA